MVMINGLESGGHKSPEIYLPEMCSSMSTQVALDLLPVTLKPTPPALPLACEPYAATYSRSRRACASSACSAELCAAAVTVSHGTAVAHPAPNSGCLLCLSPAPYSTSRPLRR